MADKSKLKICPICNQEYNERPALSRLDNKTEICPKCGMMEALENYEKNNSTLRRKGGKNEI